jgi:hypothetical protein
MDVHPVRFVKDHPVATIVLIGTGYGLSRYGFMLPLPRLGFRAKVAAGGGED